MRLDISRSFLGLARSAARANNRLTLCSVLALAASLVVSSVSLPLAAMAQSSHAAKAHHKKHRAKKNVEGTAQQPQASSAETENPSVAPQLLRLSEILGALAYLEPLCGQDPKTDWRAETMSLVQAEAKTDLVKEAIAGSYNHGYQGYAFSYRRCTANAEKTIFHFVREGAKISQEIIDRFGTP